MRFKPFTSRQGVIRSRFAILMRSSILGRLFPPRHWLPLVSLLFGAGERAPWMPRMNPKTGVEPQIRKRSVGGRLAGTAINKHDVAGACVMLLALMGFVLSVFAVNKKAQATRLGFGI